MNVLIVCDIKNLPNPFVATICDELRHVGVSVEASTEKFWEDTSMYDIVHFQWPEAVFSWKRRLENSEVDRFRRKIEELKSAGIKIVLTCHNLKPHTIKDKNVMSLYEIINNNCDLFLHMGKYSLSLLKDTYPIAQHCILPHHLYDRIYHFNKTKEECRKALGISMDKCCILCFGTFRTNEERRLVLGARNILKRDSYVFLLPGFYKNKILNKNPLKIIKRLIYTLYYRSIGIKMRKDFINTEDTEIYFGAADIVLLQRVSILNSGNLPMAFAAGKVVVGPNVGNVGDILTLTGNPTFESKHVSSVVDAIRNAEKLVEKDKGEENKHYAESFWKGSVVAKQLSIYYNEILDSSKTE